MYSTRKTSSYQQIFLLRVMFFLALLSALVTVGLLTSIQAKYSESVEDLMIAVLRPEIISADSASIITRVNSTIGAGLVECVSITRSQTVLFENLTGCSWTRPFAIRGFQEAGVKVQFVPRFPRPMLTLQILIGIAHAAVLTVIFGLGIRMSRHEKQERERLSLLTRQLAHDIRSPAQALAMVLEHLPEGPAKQLISAAAGRIHSLAETVRTQTEVDSSALTTSDKLNQIIQRVTEEKKLGFLGSIVFQPHSNSQKVKMEPDVFERIVSNILNNSIEKGARHITIELETRDDKLIFIFCDNGGGFPPMVLKNQGIKEVSIGKPGGSGLGLSHARRVLAQFGGTLELSNEAPDRAIVKIAVPLHKA